VIRFNMLHTHYRQPMDWTVRGLQESMGILDYWYDIAGDTNGAHPAAGFLEALADDLNTPLAITELHGLATQAHGGNSTAREELATSLEVLGLFQWSKEAWIASTRRVSEIDPKKVDKLIAARNEARKARNFTEADRIRAELRVMRVVVKDNKDGTTSWEVVR
jgi:cysteinyl-tRNA synthetase